MATGVYYFGSQISKFKNKCNFIQIFNTHLSKHFLSTTVAYSAKEVRYVENEDNILIEAVKVPSPRTPNLIQSDKDRGCPICSLNLQRYLQPSDVLILSQFMDSEGNTIPMKITGLCIKQHIIVTSLIKKAQDTGLLPKKADDPDPMEWKKPKRYFEKQKVIKHMDNQRTYEDFPRPYW